jgi:repressor of nif and glnA expression
MANNGIERRLPGENITAETRSDAHDKVDKKKRYRQILEILNGNEMTAKEIAVEMCKRGYIPTSERNHVSPRLTEMGQEGTVEPIGKKKCEYTGRTVSVWAVCGG